MTQLLVSVRSGDEANQALAGGAAWIDVKEPGNGSLGAPSARQLDLVRQVVRGRATLSVALGELCDEPTEELMSELDGVSFAKVGLSHCVRDAQWRQGWVDRMRRLPAGIAPVAVAYADYGAAGAPSPQSVIEFARQQACRMLLCDTFDKSRGNLFDYFSDGTLRELIAMARAANLRVALAGSVTLEMLPRVVACAPDIIAVRGAACRGGRNGHVDAAMVKQLASQMSTPRARPRTNSSIHILDSVQQHS